MNPIHSPSPEEKPTQKRNRRADFRPRDREVIDPFGLGHIRFAETRHLAVFLVPDPFPTYDALRHRLRTLESEKMQYLDRPGERIKASKQPTHRVRRDGRPQGRPQDVWAMGPKTAALHDVAGDWRKNNSRLSPTSFQHPLLVTSVYATLRAAEVRGLIGLEKWIPEDGYKVAVSIEGKERSLLVDGGASVADKRSGRGTNFFLEADNHTEPYERRDVLENPDASLLKKYLIYRAYWRDVLPKGMPFLVLTLAKDPVRAERLRRTAARTDAKGHGLNVFWFNDETKWDPREPERFLYEPIFTTAAEETRSLFRGDLDG